MTLCGEYAQVLDIVKRYIARFSQEEQDMILGGNADHFYLHRCHSFQAPALILALHLCHSAV